MTLTANMRSSRSDDISSTRCGVATMPALLTRPSSRPNVPSMAEKIEAIPSQPIPAPDSIVEAYIRPVEAFAVGDKVQLRPDMPAEYTFPKDQSAVMTVVEVFPEPIFVTHEGHLHRYDVGCLFSYVADGQPTSVVFTYNARFLQKVTK